MKIGFSTVDFSKTNWNLFSQFCKELQEIHVFNETDDDVIEMSDLKIIVTYKYASPVKPIRKIINKYKLLKQ